MIRTVPGDWVMVGTEKQAYLVSSHPGKAASAFVLLWWFLDELYACCIMAAASESRELLSSVLLCFGSAALRTIRVPPQNDESGV